MLWNHGNIILFRILFWNGRKGYRKQSGNRRSHRACKFKTHTHTHTQETITKLQNSQKQQVINETCTVTNIHRTAEETCNILTQTTTPRDCAQKHSCGDCTSSSLLSCQYMMNNVGSNGYCDNGGTCCLSETYVILSIYLFAYAYIDT